MVPAMLPYTAWGRAGVGATATAIAMAIATRSSPRLRRMKSLLLSVVDGMRKESLKPLSKRAKGDGRPAGRETGHTGQGENWSDPTACVIAPSRDLKTA